MFDHDEIHLPSLEILTCACARAHTHTHRWYIIYIWFGNWFLGLLFV